MTHYHEVYFNKHTGDGPRVGMTRRRKSEIVTERAVERAEYRYVHPGAGIVRCDRPDNRCPWTVEGVPGKRKP